MREGDERQTGSAPPASRPPRPRGVGRTSALALLGIGVALLVHLRAWLFICDDAFISFRYARNLATHGQLVYNLAPLERVEGYTNFLWVLILALGDALGLVPERLAPLLTAGSSLAILLLVALISAQLRRRAGPDRADGDGPVLELVDLLGPAWLVTVPEFVVWASSGLETSFAVALGLLAVWLWLGGRIEGAGAAAAATALARPDALVWIAALGLGWLAVVGLEHARARSKPTIPWRRVVVASVLFVAPLLASLMFRRLYYGAWLPNTWAVKHHGAALRDVYGVAYLEWWFVRLRVIWLVPLALCLRPRHLPLLLPIAAVLAWAWSIGGDFMAYGRFALPATVLLATLVGVVLAELRAWVQARGWLGSTHSHVLWAALALAWVVGSAAAVPDRIAADRARAHLHVDERAAALGPGFEGVDGMQRFAAVRVAAGARLAERVPADTRITVGAAGALPYASMLPAYDSYGLVDPGVVAVAEPRTSKGARPGHQLHAPIDYMKSREPDLMCHVGYAGEQLPPPGLDRRMGAGREWTGWACVETGAIPDPRAEGGTLPSQVYCCMRPRGRFEQLDESLLRRSR